MKIFTKEQFEEHNKKILSEKEDNSSKNEISGIDIMYDFLSDIKKIKDDTQIIESELESMKIFTKEQFEEHNKKILSEKEDDSSKKEIPGIDIMYDFLSDIKKIKDDTQIIESELEKKSESDHTHEEFTQINDKISNLKENISKIKENISSEIKNVKSSIKHYDDNPVLERINTIQEEVKTLEERVSGIKIPEINLTGFLKEKDIKNLANKKEVYNKEETYNKDEVYTKKEVYNKKEIDERIKNNQGGSTSIVGGASFMGDLQDVKLSNTENGQILVYDEVTKRWINQDLPVNKLLELVGKDCTLTYNGSNQVLTQTYIDGTVTTNTYTSGVITQTSTIFPDETTITVTYNYTGGLVSSIEYN